MTDLEPGYPLANVRFGKESRRAVFGEAGGNSRHCGLLLLPKRLSPKKVKLGRIQERRSVSLRLKSNFPLPAVAKTKNIRKIIQMMRDAPNQIGSADTEYVASECLIKLGARPVVQAIQTTFVEKTAIVREKIANITRRNLSDNGT